MSVGLFIIGGNNTKNIEGEPEYFYELNKKVTNTLQSIDLSPRKMTGMGKGDTPPI